MREEEKRFCTIKELYDWAVENGYENYDVYVCAEGHSCNISLNEMFIKEKEILLTL